MNLNTRKLKIECVFMYIGNILVGIILPVTCYIIYNPTFFGSYTQNIFFVMLTCDPKVSSTVDTVNDKGITCQYYDLPLQ
jgi:hypothetical protein